MIISSVARDLHSFTAKSGPNWSFHSSEAMEGAKWKWIGSGSSGSEIDSEHFRTIIISLPAAHKPSPCRNYPEHRGVLYSSAKLLRSLLRVPLNIWHASLQAARLLRTNPFAGELVTTYIKIQLNSFNSSIDSTDFSPEQSFPLALEQAAKSWAKQDWRALQDVTRTHFIW